MLGRQREGIAKAKADGKYRGRAPTGQKQSAEIETLLAQGHGPTDIAEKLCVARIERLQSGEGCFPAAR
jgi:DNA invertase Pin-like site-specific DNA recombinase